MTIKGWVFKHMYSSGGRRWYKKCLSLKNNQVQFTLYIHTLHVLGNFQNTFIDSREERLKKNLGDNSVYTGTDRWAVIVAAKLWDFFISRDAQVKNFRPNVLWASGSLKFINHQPRDKITDPGTCKLWGDCRRRMQRVAENPEGALKLEGCRSIPSEKFGKFGVVWVHSEIREIHMQAEYWSLADASL